MKNNKSPLIQVSKRVSAPKYLGWLVRAIAIVAALLICAVVTTFVTGENPVQVFIAIFNGSFGTSRKFWVLLQNVAMLLCVSLAVTPAFRMRF